MMIKTMYKKLAYAFGAFIYMTASLQGVQADDTEVYVGQKLVAGSVIRPNVLFIIDTSGSMDTRVDGNYCTKADYDFNSNACSRVTTKTCIRWRNGRCREYAYEYSYVKTRIQVVREVTQNLLDDLIASNKPVNVGLMRFDSNSDGGFIDVAIDKIEDTKSSIKNTLDSYYAQGGTPLSMSLYEAARYYMGQDIEYGSDASGCYIDYSGYVRCTNRETDASALLTPTKYKSPINHSCQSNNVILLTDGVPYNDYGANKTIRNWAANNTNKKTCGDTNNYDDNNDSGDCLDELAEFLFSTDGDIIDKLDSNDDGNTDEILFTKNDSVKTYTVGFATDQQLLRETALSGTGDAKNYFTTNNTSGLVSALQEIIQDILSQDANFAAPGVAVNAYNKLTHKNELYYSMFKPETGAAWTGNLKRYALEEICHDSNDNTVDCNSDTVSGSETLIVDSSGQPATDMDPSSETAGFFKKDARSWWSTVDDGGNVALGGAAEQITPANRTLLTYTATPPGPRANALSDKKSLSPLSTATVNNTLLGIGIEPSDSSYTLNETTLVAFAEGRQVTVQKSGEADKSTQMVMADVLHSQPLVIPYRVEETQDGDILKDSEGNPITGSDGLAIRDVNVTQADYLFYGDNMGFLRAVNTQTGAEKFAFMPGELLPNIKHYFKNLQGSEEKRYGIDGPINAWVQYTYQEDAAGDLIDTVGIRRSITGTVEAGSNGIPDLQTATRVILYFGMRRGGHNYYAMDVTDIDQPKLLWAIRGLTVDKKGNRLDRYGRSLDASNRVINYANGDLAASAITSTPLAPDSGFEKLGQSWSRPVLAKVPVGKDADGKPVNKQALIFTAGYDPNQDNDDDNLPVSDHLGNAIYVVDAETGQLIWSAGGPNTSHYTSRFNDLDGDNSNDLDTNGDNYNDSLNLKIADMTNGMPGDVVAVDVDGDGVINTLFAADTRAQVFRIDFNRNKDTTAQNCVTNCLASYASGGRIASLGGSDAASNRRFYGTPDVSIYSERGEEPFYAVALGSGWRAHPLNTDTRDRFYVFKDYNVLTTPTSYTYASSGTSVITESHLADITGTTLSDAEWAELNRELECIQHGETAGRNCSGFTQADGSVADYANDNIDALVNASKKAQEVLDAYRDAWGVTVLMDQRLALQEQLDALQKTLDTQAEQLAYNQSVFDDIASQAQLQEQVVAVQDIFEDYSLLSTEIETVIEPTYQAAETNYNNAQQAVADYEQVVIEKEQQLKNTQSAVAAKKEIDRLEPTIDEIKADLTILEPYLQPSEQAQYETKLQELFWNLYAQQYYYYWEYNDAGSNVTAEELEQRKNLYHSYLETSGYIALEPFLNKSTPANTAVLTMKIGSRNQWHNLFYLSTSQGSPSYADISVKTDQLVADKTSYDQAQQTLIDLNITYDDVETVHATATQEYTAASNQLSDLQNTQSEKLAEKDEALSNYNNALQEKADYESAINDPDGLLTQYARLEAFQTELAQSWTAITEKQAAINEARLNGDDTSALEAELATLEASYYGIPDDLDTPDVDESTTGQVAQRDALNDLTSEIKTLEQEIADLKAAGQDSSAKEIALLEKQAEWQTSVLALNTVTAGTLADAIAADEDSPFQSLNDSVAELESTINNLKTELDAMQQQKLAIQSEQSALEQAITWQAEEASPDSVLETYLDANALSQLKAADPNNNLTMAEALAFLDALNGGSSNDPDLDWVYSAATSQQTDILTALLGGLFTEATSHGDADGNGTLSLAEALSYISNKLALDPDNSSLQSVYDTLYGVDQGRLALTALNDAAQTSAALQAAFLLEHDPGDNGILEASDILTADQLAAALAADENGVLTVEEAFAWLVDEAEKTAAIRTAALQQRLDALILALEPGDTYTLTSDYFNNKDGWYLSLGATEKVLSNSVTINGAVFFNTYNTTTNSTVMSCGPDVGQANAYALNLLDGTAVYQDEDGNPIRSVALLRGGIAPAPVITINNNGVNLTIGTEGNPFTGNRRGDQGNITPINGDPLSQLEVMESTYWRENK
ncbi:hypothetical protein GCM10023116_18570 [Kistimonas scapharcae]|uniref:VWFA domain-containing protein n=1 Tax=Kistimonas scapharcae TaxID=1036133 RepID=A0ABP8V2C5_9GAMM